MKRAILLVTATLLLMLILAPVALAQGTMMTSAAAGASAGAMSASAGATGGALAPSGGPAILLPAAALLLGTGVLTYTILRRR